MDGRRSGLYAASQAARIQSLAPLPASLPAPRRRSRQCLQPVPVVAGSGARAPHLPVEQARQREQAWSTVGDWSECTCQPALLRPIPDATPLLFHLAFLRSFLPLLAGFAWQPTNGNRRGAHRPWAHLLALGGRSVSKPLLPFVDRG